MSRTLTSLFSILFLFFSFAAFSGTQASQPPKQIMFTATINASQEGNVNDTSRGAGTMWGILNSDRTSLAYHITYAGLTSNFTASHFHLGAAGVSGGVVKSIQFNGNTASGSWDNLPDTIVAKLLKGEIYVNIHTANFPNGEIRGQVMPVNGIGFSISLDGSQVNPAVVTNASGTGWAVLSNDGNNLNYNITFAGLSGSFSAAHFHSGNTGNNGGVVHPVTFTDSSAAGTWANVPGDNLISLLRDGLYVNIHSSNYPNGEIRGQVIRVNEISFTASLDGNQEVPAVNTPAMGTAWAVLNDSLNSLNYNITYANLSGTFSASHFHLGAAGVSGSVVYPVTTFKGNTAFGTLINIPDSNVVHFIRGGFYLNIHSSSHPGGEIRGQVLLNNGIALTASLNGSQEVPAVVTNSSGSAWLLFKDDTLKFQITIAGLSSAYAASHFHLAAAGVNGSVVHPFTLTDSTLNSSWTNIDDATLSTIVKGNTYMNVHTSGFPNGEIRGQVYPASFSNGSVTSVDDGGRTIIRNYKLSQNYPNPFNPATNIEFQIASSSGGGFVSLKVYDLLGREVATLVNEFKPEGSYIIKFDGSKLASGMYIYQLKVNGFTEAKKLQLLK